MAKQTVALYTVTSGDRVARARESLAEALGGAELGAPDDAGGFELSVDAESPEAARELVREAFARAGTGDDFVIRETTEGREMAAEDPRQAGSDEAVAAAAASDGGGDDDADGGPDPAARLADAASAVAAAASSAASSDAATAARSAASDAADSVREAVEEKGVAGAASDYASTAQESRWAKFVPLGAALLLLVLVRRARR